MIQPETSTRLLVVDDNEGMVSTLRDILGAAGYWIDVAYSGQEAVERVRECRPDGILMDIRMPGMDGVEAFREIKQLSPESFVIFMTAYATSALVEDAREEGAVEVIPKPLDIQHVLRLLEETSQATPILLVDDDSAFNHSLTEALAAQDFDVRAAATVDEALSLFQKEPRRVVILDMKLDGRDGPEASSGLEALPLLKKLNPQAIVILMSGFLEYQEPMRQGLAMSAAACMTKPFEVADLVHTIQEAVESRRGIRAEAT